MRCRWLWRSRRGWRLGGSSRRRRQWRGWRDDSDFVFSQLGPNTLDFQQCGVHVTLETNGSHGLAASPLEQSQTGFSHLDQQVADLLLLLDRCADKQLLRNGVQVQLGCTGALVGELSGNRDFRRQGVDVLQLVDFQYGFLAAQLFQRLRN